MTEITAIERVLPIRFQTDQREIRDEEIKANQEQTGKNQDVHNQLLFDDQGIGSQIDILA